MENRLLVLIRHAHREKPFGQTFDNGLADRGKVQARQVRDRWLPELQGKSVALFSSPKKRCLETLNPLSEHLKIQTVVEPLLDEQSYNESSVKFESRIEQFIDSWKAGKAQVTFACSHGDWIPVCVGLLFGTEVPIGKADWTLVVQKEGELFPG